MSDLWLWSGARLRSPKVVTTKPTIIRNPADDQEFERAIDEALEAGSNNPAAIEARLRERYPRAVVRPRELEAERTAIWYVYREGRWIRGSEG